MKSPTIFVCSPFQGKEENRQKAIEYCKRIAACGCIPFAPHIYFPLFLDDNIPEQRELGISAGIAFMPYCTYFFSITEVWETTPGMDIESGIWNEQFGTKNMYSLLPEHIENICQRLLNEVPQTEEKL